MAKHKKHAKKEEERLYQALPNRTRTAPARRPEG